MAPCEWVIDIIKEWVTGKGYATQAWVTAKNYATQAWVTAKGYATQAWVTGQGYLTTGFVRRVTVADYDWIGIELTANSAWHTLDCSLEVPEGTKAILFNQVGRNDSIGKFFSLRYPNDRQWNMTPGLHTQVANVILDRCNVVACNTDREIEYRLTTGGWTYKALQVVGWWV